MKKNRCKYAFASVLLLGATYSSAVQAATCEYVISNEWNAGFTGLIRITNDDTTVINGWQIGWEYSDGSQITNSWNANISGSNPYTASNLSWNGSIAVGDSVEFGFQGTKGRVDNAAIIPVITGAVCDGGTTTPVNNAPVAAIEATPTTGTAPLDVSFSAAASTDEDNDVLTYSWNFGDGSSATGVTADHTYAAAGSYDVVVTVSDGELTDTASTTIVVTSETGNTPPVADIAADVTSGTAPLTVNFDGTGSIDADGDTLTYSWDFGDGAYSTLSQPSHTFTTVGSYVVTLTVSDGEATDADTIAISVTDGSGVTRVDNPFRDAVWYVNPEWSANAAAEPGGSAIANYNTAVWMDRIGAIEGTDTAMGLRDHLNEALNQGANLFMFVVYDLPNRDCNALASNGELLIAEGGMARYKAEYIDAIADILADPAYQSLRIAAIIEIDSLPNLVTNLDVPACQEAAGDDGYEEGITYALNALAPIDNVYSYIDAAHSGWLGWDSNFGPAVDLIASVVTGSDEGWDSVAGFITNTSNYTPTVEKFLPDPYLNVSGQPVRSADFYEWNPYFDEKSYAQEFRRKMIAKGAPSTIGMLIDTGRNGWGRDDRPTSVSSSSDLNTYANNSRIDRRSHRGNWCNQAGGIGYKPWADPYTGVDAFVWVKPPGESDGIADPNFEQDPDDPNKQHDGMCDPNAASVENSSVSTGSLPGAPHAGRWFSEGFRVLLENAYPPADAPAGPPEE